MKVIKGYIALDDSWWAIRRGGRAEPTTVCSVEVQEKMTQSKLFAVHAEADSKAELIARIQMALAELGVLGAAPAAEKPAKGAKKEEASEKPAKPAKGAAKISLDQVKQALTKLRAAVGGDDDPDKVGIKAVKKVLRAFGVAQSPDLKEEQYADVMAAIEAAMPAVDEDADEEGEGY